MPVRTIVRELFSENREHCARGLRRLTRTLSVGGEEELPEEERHEERAALAEKDCEARLLALTESEHEALRELAADALGAWGGDAAFAALARLTEDEIRQVRASAVGALEGWPGNEEAYELLLGGMDDSDWLVRMRAARALTGHEGVDAERALIAGLADPDSFVRHNCADALRHRDPDRILPGLRRLFDHPAPELLDGAFSLFGDLGTAEDARFLRKVGAWTNLTQPAPVKRAARDAARRIKSRLSDKNK